MQMQIPMIGVNSHALDVAIFLVRRNFNSIFLN